MRLDNTEKWLLRGFILGLIMVAAGFLVGCHSDGSVDMGWLPASQDYAAQVAQDNAASAATNPVSFWLWAGGTALSSLLGSIGLIRRGIKQFDDQPFEAEDGRKVSEEEIVQAVLEKRQSPPAP